LLKNGLTRPCRGPGSKSVASCIPARQTLRRIVLPDGGTLPRASSENWACPHSNKLEAIHRTGSPNASQFIVLVWLISNVQIPGAELL
jgi:hypothetical protein